MSMSALRGTMQIAAAAEQSAVIIGVGRSSLVYIVYRRDIVHLVMGVKRRDYFIHKEGGIHYGKCQQSVC